MWNTLYNWRWETKDKETIGYSAIWKRKGWRHRAHCGKLFPDNWYITRFKNFWSHARHQIFLNLQETSTSGKSWTSCLNNVQNLVWWKCALEIQNPRAGLNYLRHWIRKSKIFWNHSSSKDTCTGKYIGIIWEGI